MNGPNHAAEGFRRDRSADAPVRPVATLIIGGTRLVLATLIAVAVVVTFADTAGRTTINPFNFFGYFTIQSNLMMAAIWTLVGIAGIRATPLPRFADYARGIVTTYVAMVGLVYATLLAPLGAAGGVPVPWANALMHIVVPIAAVMDWILIADRRTLRWRLLPLVLIYPVVWLAVVVVRGATDGWVPYPFLDPDRGYGTVGVTVLAITVVTVLAGAAMFALSRLSISRVRPRTRSR